MYTTIAAAPGVEAAKEIGVGVKQNLTQAATWVDRMFDMAIDYAPRLIGAIVLFVLAYMIASWARRAIYKAFNRPQFDQTLVRFFSNAARWTILVVALVAVLGMIGIPTTSVLAVMGAAGLAIGLAVKDSLSNLASGIMLLMLRPFSVGDTVKIGGQDGRVDQIGLFHTTLDTLDNRRIFMPNGVVFGAQIENITHHSKRRVDLTVGVEYAADIEATRAVLVRAAAGVEGAMTDPAPEIALANLGASSVDWQVQVWCLTADYGLVKQRLVRSVKLSLDEAKIDIPFPQMQVWMRGAGK